jgi:hypothetical protein
MLGGLPITNLHLIELSVFNSCVLKILSSDHKSFSSGCTMIHDLTVGNPIKCMELLNTRFTTKEKGGIHGL